MEVASSSSNKFSTSKYRKFSRRQRQLSRSAVSCAVITNYFELENKSAEDDSFGFNVTPHFQLKNTFLFI
jgi:hypothetical protein